MANIINPSKLYVRNIGPFALSGRIWNSVNGEYNISGADVNGYPMYVLNPSNSATRVWLKVRNYGELHWTFNVTLTSGLEIPVFKSELGRTNYNAYNPANSRGPWYSDYMELPYGLDTIITYEPIAYPSSAIFDSNDTSVYIGYYRYSGGSTFCNRPIYKASDDVQSEIYYDSEQIVTGEGVAVGAWVHYNSITEELDWLLIQDSSLPITDGVGEWVSVAPKPASIYANSIIAENYFNYPTLDFINTLQANDPYNPFINTNVVLLSSTHLFGPGEAGVVNKFKLINAYVFGDFYEFLFRTEADTSEADLYLTSDINSTSLGIIGPSGGPGWVLWVGGGGAAAYKYTASRGIDLKTPGVSSGWYNWSPNVPNLEMYIGRESGSPTAWETRRIAGGSM